MNIGKLLVLAGIALIVLGVLVMVLNRFNVPIGRLPGDIVIRGKSSTFYFPWVTCLVLSILGTLLLWLFNRRP